MTTKAEFNAEEWGKIAEGPALAGLIVIASQRGGTIRESLAMAKVYAEAQEEARARRPGRRARPVGAAPEREAVLEQGGPAHPRPRQDPRGGRAGRGKATPEELDEYRAFVLDVAQHAAEADKSGGFLGIGGERVSGNEEAR